MKRRTAESRVGETIGSLTVISMAATRGPTGQKLYSCLCQCGTIFDAIASNVVSGHTKSCGCRNAEAGLNKRTHGHCLRSRQRTSEYHSYRGMLRRCANPEEPAYPDYGGRGITVCPRWLESFSNFISDMGEKPTPQHSLERLDNNEGYSPENCVWATREDQARNKRNNLMLTFRGETQCLATWCEELNLDYDTVNARVSAYGWAADKALTTPTNRPWKPYKLRKAAYASVSA